MPLGMPLRAPFEGLFAVVPRAVSMGEAGGDAVAWSCRLPTPDVSRTAQRAAWERPQAAANARRRPLWRMANLGAAGR